MKNIKIKNKNYIMLTLLVLVLISIACFSSITSSNGTEVLKNNTTYNLADSNKVILNAADLENDNSYNVSNNNDNGDDNNNGSDGNNNNSNSNNNNSDVNESNHVSGNYKEYNESTNVILEFSINHYARYYTASCISIGTGDEIFLIIVSLNYKNNNTPIPNQIVYITIGNETKEFMTDENGTIQYQYFQREYGVVNIEALFNGSKIDVNGLIIDLEPVSVHIDYNLGEKPTYITLEPLNPYNPWKPYNPWGQYKPWSQYNPVNLNIDFDLIVSSSKNLTIDESKYENNSTEYKNDPENNRQTAYAEMKETGVPFIQLIVALISIVSIFAYKKDE
jgi:hypothetical protein